MKTATKPSESKKFQPSKYQQALFDFITAGKGNALVCATAGSGKSTSLIQAIQLVPQTKDVHFFAFGKAIVEDLKTKIPNTHNVSVSTIHSFGMKSIMRSSTSKPTIDDRKYHKLFDSMYIDMKDGQDSPADARRRTLPLVDLARVNMANCWEDVLAMSVKYDVAATESDCKLALSIIKAGLKELSTIDMTDMIWLPVALKMQVAKFDFAFIDEAQDLSELQRTLVLMSVRPKTGRFVAIGDDKQSIFGFAGSDVESFNKFKKLPNVTELPLSISYRCPTEVIKLAKTLVPYIEASSTAKAGEVKNDAKIADIVAGDLILCRNTYPLVKLGFQYIASGQKAHIAGRDIGKNLINMIRKTKSTSFDMMYEKLTIELDKIECDLIRTRKMSKADAMGNSQYTSHEDKVEAIRVVAEGCSTIDEVVNKIDSIFSDDKGDGILLSTIHKAKGLEANNVYIIHQELMPSKNAKMAWAVAQEYNLMYVAYTRAKNRLGFITDFDAYSKVGGNVVKKAQSESKVKTSEPVKAVEVEVKVVSAPMTAKVGEIITEVLRITEIKAITSKFGSTSKYVMVSRGGSVVTKLGSMQFAEIISGQGLKVGTIVKLSAPVKDITNNQFGLGMLIPVQSSVSKA